MESAEIPIFRFPPQVSVQSHRRARSGEASSHIPHVPTLHGWPGMSADLVSTQQAQQRHLNAPPQPSGLSEVLHRRAGSDSASAARGGSHGLAVKGLEAGHVASSRPPLPRHVRAHSAAGPAMWQAKTALDSESQGIGRERALAGRATGIHCRVNSDGSNELVAHDLRGPCPPCHSGTCHVAARDVPERRLASGDAARWRFPSSLSCPEAIQVWEVADEASYEADLPCHHMAARGSGFNAELASAAVARRRDTVKVDLPWPEEGFGCSIRGVPEAASEASRKGDKIIITDTDDFVAPCYAGSQSGGGTRGASPELNAHSPFLGSTETPGRGPVFPGSLSCPLFLEDWPGAGGGGDGGECGSEGELTWQDVQEAEGRSRDWEDSHLQTGHDVTGCSRRSSKVAVACIHSCQGPPETPLAHCQAGNGCCLHGRMAGCEKLHSSSPRASCQCRRQSSASCGAIPNPYSIPHAGCQRGIHAALYTHNRMPDNQRFAPLSPGPTRACHAAEPPSPAVICPSQQMSMSGRRRWASDQILYPAGVLLALTSPRDRTWRCQVAGGHPQEHFTIGCRADESPPTLGRRMLSARLAQHTGRGMALFTPPVQHHMADPPDVHHSSRHRGPRSSNSQRSRAQSADAAFPLLNLSIPEPLTPPTVVVQVSPCDDEDDTCGPVPVELPRGDAGEVHVIEGHDSPVVIEVSPASQVGAQPAGDQLGPGKEPSTPRPSPADCASLASEATTPVIDITTPSPTTGQHRIPPPTAINVPTVAEDPSPVLLIELTPAASLSGSPVGSQKETGSILPGVPLCSRKESETPAEVGLAAPHAALRFPQSKSCPGRPMLITVDDADGAPSGAGVAVVDADVAHGDPHRRDMPSVWMRPRGSFDAATSSRKLPWDITGRTPAFQVDAAPVTFSPRFPRSASSPGSRAAYHVPDPAGLSTPLHIPGSFLEHQGCGAPAGNPVRGRRGSSMEAVEGGPPANHLNARRNTGKVSGNFNTPPRPRPRAKSMAAVGRESVLASPMIVDDSQEASLLPGGSWQRL